MASPEHIDSETLSLKTSDALTVLIVDDNRTNILVLQKTLKKTGYRIVSALNGKDGIALAKTENPSLILLDVIMPEQNGFEVIEKLKKDPLTAKIPVIFITGEEDVESKLKGFELGAVDYIVKPFHAREVEARVNLHVKLFQTTSQLIENQAEKLKEISASQNALLITPDQIPEAKFRVFFQPLHEAGGDLYDVIKISDEIFGYFIGDVSGHDIGAGFVTASMAALLKQNCTPFNKPTESMAIINNVLVELLAEEMYITGVYVQVNRLSKKMNIIVMGHPPVLFLPKGGEPELLKGKNFFLGMFEDTPYTSIEVSIAPGDRFFLYTDGLIENESEMWAVKKDCLLEVAPQISNLPLDSIVQGLVDTLIPSFDSVNDDVTVLCIEI